MLVLICAIIFIDVLDSNRRRHVAVSVFLQYCVDKRFHGLIVGRMSDKSGAFALNIASIIQIIDRVSDVLVAGGKMIGNARPR